MAFRLKKLVNGLCMSGRWNHVATAVPAPLGTSMMSHGNIFALPENDKEFEFGSNIGSMELMAVPKRKVSKHKRGIRNGPRALKPIPLIMRCRSCGRVKLPHFYCCSGDRGITGECAEELSCYIAAVGTEE
ncbi:hypothetical protein IFM89_014219 [Coptis chinensis]|uniref:Large ribosomal subunit protein bL32m n=1 Tax=Coptis chinensis TaxID=261450 RepID=A0A835MF59_9MAGN|nr:hypothetical protein IFM89_014219 [Coptis chinensis]